MRSVFKIVSLFIALGFTQGNNLFAQDFEPSAGVNPPQKLARVDIRGLGTIPETMSNEAFSKSFDGVYNLNFSFNVRLVKGAFIGLALNNALFEITPTKIPGLSTKMHLYGVGGQLGYDFQFNDKVMLSWSASAGYNYTFYHSVVSLKNAGNPAGYHYESIFMESELNCYFFVERNFAISANFSYNITTHAFDPNFIFLNEYKGYRPEDKNGNTGFFNFGFGFYFGFLKAKDGQ